MACHYVRKITNREAAHVPGCGHCANTEIDVRRSTACDQVSIIETVFSLTTFKSLNPMLVDTKSVQGRRDLNFGSLDEVVSRCRTTGYIAQREGSGYSPSSPLLSHLTTAINGSIEGISVKAPWYMRLVARLMKGRILRNKLSPGLRLPKAAEAALFPAAGSPHAALEGLRAAVRRTHTEQMIAPHPAPGKLTHEEWTQMHLRHAELHLSFVVPN